MKYPHRARSLTSDINESVLLQYAFLGRDTITRIFGIGKDRIMNSKHLLKLCKEAAETFYLSMSTKLQVEDAGMKLLLAIYNKKSVERLNKLCFKIFMEKICSGVSPGPKMARTFIKPFGHWLEIGYE